MRPRFKELLGHPLAVLALGNSHWAAWVRGLGLTGGVIAQATILNSFSHYHTPLLISLERTLVALVLGSLLGLIGLPISRWVVALVARWLQHDASSLNLMLTVPSKHVPKRSCRSSHCHVSRNVDADIDAGIDAGIVQNVP